MQRFWYLFVVIVVVAATNVGSGEAAILPSGTTTTITTSESAQPSTDFPGSDAAAPIDLDGGDSELGAITPQTTITTTTTTSITEFEAPCSMSSSEVNECIRNLFHAITPKLKGEGLPQYNFGSIDPYYFKRGIFRYANDGVQGGLLIKNMEINGISGLRINSVQSNFTENGFVFKLGAELPQLKAGGHFKADVKFGGLRLVPKGPFNITIDNVKATVLTDGHIEQLPDGNQKLILHRLNANVRIGNAQIIANGIFSDRNMNAMILNLVNENLPEITRVGIPATREQWAPILVMHINEFFAQVPIQRFLVQ